MEAIYRLAVCEDEDIIRQEILRLCHEVLEQHGIPHKIAAFSSAEELEKAMETGIYSFDLLLLDIQMEGMTGMELAKKLRACEDRVSIIFISGCEEYLREGYSVQPVHFLVKPVDREKLSEALLTDWKLNSRPQTVLLQKGSRSLKLTLASICYAETGANHSVKISSENQDFMFPLTLGELGSRLPAERFVRCHNSYLINLDHVQAIEGKTFRLMDGKCIPIGRKYYKECQNAFIEYLNMVAR